MLHYIYLRGDHKTHRMSVLVRQLLECDVVSVNGDIYRNSVDIVLGTNGKITRAMAASLQAYADSFSVELFID